MKGKPNPLDGFVVDRQAIGYAGRDLRRPECVLAARDGWLWVSDARGGVVGIGPGGAQQVLSPAGKRAARSSLSPADHVDEAARLTQGSLPNGLALSRDGAFVIANFGTDRVEILRRDGSSDVLVHAIGGAPMGKVNFVLRDSRDRLWITVSTRAANWIDAMRPGVADGFVALHENGITRIVADGFRFTNEIRLDAREEWLYVAETCGRRITRLKVEADGSLSHREVYGPSDTGAFIDGIAFDAHGNLWGTHIMSDRVFAIAPDGEFRILLDDADPEPSRTLNTAFLEDAVTPDMMLACAGTIAPWFTSIAFGGPDLRNVYIGSLRGTRLPWFRSPVPGLPMVHWS